MDELKAQLLDANKETCIAALKLVRKRAQKKENISCYTEELLKLVQGDDLEIKLLVCKIGMSFVNGLAFVSLSAADIDKHRETLTMLVTIYLTALEDRLAVVRKAAIYGIDKIRFRFVQAGNIENVLGEQALKRLALHIADTGIDLNENNEPVQQKGILSIASKVSDTIREYPKSADLSPVLYQLIPALEEMHYYISNGIIESGYGQKLIDKIVKLFRVLLVFRTMPLPPSSHPDTFPNYIVELLNFCNDHKYHEISDSTIYTIKSYLIDTKRYLGALVRTLQVDSYEREKDVVLYLLADAIEKGYSLNYFIPEINTAIANGTITEDQLPDLIKTLLVDGVEN